MMRYYWEALFSIEYFPYWEFTMIMMLAMLLSILWRLNRIENTLNDTNEIVNCIFQVARFLDSENLEFELVERLEIDVDFKEIRN